MNENQLTCSKTHHLKGEILFVCVCVGAKVAGVWYNWGQLNKNAIIAQMKYLEITRVNIKAGEGLWRSEKARFNIKEK